MLVGPNYLNFSTMLIRWLVHGFGCWASAMHLASLAHMMLSLARILIRDQDIFFHKRDKTHMNLDTQVPSPLLLLLLLLLLLCSMKKHTCNLWSRTFSNGRALGGHMGSHMTHSLLIPISKRREKNLKKKKNTIGASLLQGLSRTAKMGFEGFR